MRTAKVIKLALASAITACSSSTTPAPPVDTGPSDTGAETSPGTHDIGEPCPKGTPDCKPGLLCAGEDPGGQCYKTCKPSTDADCGDATKYACSSEGHCYLRCNTTADCARAAEGYVCKPDTPPRPPVKFCDVP